MSSSHEIDPQELTLPDLSDDIGLHSGPVIDTSDEFPLPDFDDAGDPDVLFPEGKVSNDSEPTTEEVPKEEESVLPSLEGVGQRSWARTIEHKPLSEMSFPEEESALKPGEDEEYFEPQLRLVREPSAPPPEPTIQNPVPSPPTPPVMVEPVTIEFDDAESDQASSTPVFGTPAQAAPVTQPGVPMGSVEGASTESGRQRVIKQRAQAVAASSSSQLAEDPTPSGRVRKVRVKRLGSSSSKVRPWVPMAGIALMAAGYFGSQPLLAQMEQVELAPSTVAIVASNPKGEVFQGGMSLGTTPVALTAQDVSSGMEIRREGYQTVLVPAVSNADPDRPPQKFALTLEPSPIVLSWAGAPEDGVVWWNGAKVAKDQLKEVKPGDYTVKMKPSNRPEVTVKIEVPAGAQGSFDVGNALAKEFAKQPVLSLDLKLPKDAKAKDLKVSVLGTDSKNPYKGSLVLSSGARSDVTLPASGKYKLAFAGNEAYKPADMTVELGVGETGKKSLELTKKPKPVAAPAPVARPYNPPPTYRPYYPPPRPYTGGGGGGGQIRPPSF